MSYENYTLNFDSEIEEERLSEYIRQLKFYFCAVDHENKTLRNITGPLQCREYGALIQRSLVCGVDEERFAINSRLHGGEIGNEVLLLRASGYTKYTENLLNNVKGTLLEECITIIKSGSKNFILFKYPGNTGNTTLGFHLLVGLLRDLQYDTLTHFDEGVPYSYKRREGDSRESTELLNISEVLGIEFTMELVLGNLVNRWPSEDVNEGRISEEGSSLQTDTVRYFFNTIKLAKRQGNLREFKRKYMKWNSSEVGWKYYEKLIEMSEQFYKEKSNAA